MLSPEDILKLRNYCQVICMKPRPIDSQFYKREGIYLWCEDWEIIELLKYLFNGKSMYLEDPAPNRLRSNPLFPGKEYIEKKALELLDKCKTIEEVINYLKEKRR